MTATKPAIPPMRLNQRCVAAANEILVEHTNDHEGQRCVLDVTGFQVAVADIIGRVAREYAREQVKKCFVIDNEGNSEVGAGVPSDQPDPMLEAARDLADSYRKARRPIDAADVADFARAEVAKALEAERAKPVYGPSIIEVLQREIAKAVLVEREQCALLCDNHYPAAINNVWDACRTSLAAQIRARGGEKG